MSAEGENGAHNVQAETGHVNESQTPNQGAGGSAAALDTNPPPEQRSQQSAA